MNNEEYIRQNPILPRDDKQIELEIIANFINTKNELKMARCNFEFASDSSLIDSLTYQIKANESKLDYLVKEAKRRGIELDMLEEAYLRNKEAI